MRPNVINEMPKRLIRSRSPCENFGAGAGTAVSFGNLKRSIATRLMAYRTLHVQETLFVFTQMCHETVKYISPIVYLNVGS